MKPSRCGGLYPARRQIDLLEDSGLMFLGSGLTDPDVALSASLALFGAYNLSFPAALNGPQFLDYSVLKSPLIPQGGKIPIPQGTGLGVAVDPEKIKPILTDL
ncbi:MAG: enolase C-terminal domain-like protein, partial [Candidatus Hinthialibacter sp.]